MIVFFGACGSSGSGGTGTSGGGGGSGYICEFTPAIGLLCTGCSGVQECDAFSGSQLNGETLTAVEETCKLETSYSNPSACPTANRIGCCNYPYVSSAINVTENSCFYGSASSETAKLPTQCSEIAGGVWTAN
jgi:hypothetical protein